MIPRLRILVFLFLAMGFSESGAQTKPDYCKRLFAEATFPPETKTLASVLSLDADRGVVISDPGTKKLNLKKYSSESAHRLESQPQKSGPLRDLKLGFQISDRGGEPREFEITQDYLENYSVRPKKNAQAIKMRVFKYRLGYRNGVCFPLSVAEIGLDKETVVFDLDRCAERNSKSSETLRCDSSKVYRDASMDPRLRVEKDGSKGAPAGKTSR